MSAPDDDDREKEEDFDKEPVDNEDLGVEDADGNSTWDSHDKDD